MCRESKHKSEGSSRLTLLLKTVHGSRLYGLAHADSDFDRFEVYGWDKGRGRQRITGQDDVTKTTYDRFMRYCEKGVPQYLEAMFSRVAEVDNFPFDRVGYGIHQANTRNTYMRTIKSFWITGVETDNFKLKRHAMRLVLNLRSMQENGRFNPMLNEDQILWVTEMAHRDEMVEPL